MIFTTILTCFTKMVEERMYEGEYKTENIKNELLCRKDFFLFDRVKMFDFITQRTDAICSKRQYFGHFITDINTNDTCNINIKRDIIEGLVLLQKNEDEIIEAYLIDFLNEFEKNEVYCYYPTKKRLNSVKYSIFFEKTKKDAFITLLKKFTKKYEMQNKTPMSMNKFKKPTSHQISKIYNFSKYLVAKNILKELQMNKDFYEEELRNAHFFMNHDDRTLKL